MMHVPGDHQILVGLHDPHDRAGALARNDH
jgi:hypothetical protein